jgi:hypothetical protein
MPWWHASRSHEQVPWPHWRVHGLAAGSCGAARAWAPGSSPQVHSARRWNVRQVKQVDFSRIGRTGKNAATAMTHATRTTRLRMTHDGSMRFWERAGVFSLFFFFSAAGTERQACRVTVVLGADLVQQMRRQNSHPQKKERIDRIVCFWPENATTMATLERGRRPASLCIREAAASRPASWMSLMSRRPPRRAATRRSLLSARRLLHGSAARELIS